MPIKGRLAALYKDRFLRFLLAIHSPTLLGRLLSPLSVLCWLSLVVAGPVAADRVYVVDPNKPNRPAKAHEGTITDFTGDKLQLQTASGRTRTFRRGRVQRIETNWSADHQSAKQALSRGLVKDALAKLRAALGKEKRRWVQRMILAESARCNRAMGEHEKSVATFLILYEDDPQTQYIGAIPVTWQATPPPLPFRRKCEQWLLDPNAKEVQKLVAASWLLSGAGRADAVRALDKLTNSLDPQLAHLANSQLWRSKLVQADANQLRQWQAELKKVPQDVRFGAYFMVASGLARQKQYKEAALTFLRVPIHYPTNRPLAAAATFAAAQQMKLAKMKGWKKLMRDVVTRYPESPQAERVRQTASAR